MKVLLISLLAYTAGIFSNLGEASPSHQLDDRGNDPKLTSRACADAPYVFATFTADNENDHNEKDMLQIYTSDNGINFELYAKDAWGGVGIEHEIRDPSIIKLDNMYYICYSSGDKDAFGFISSQNLKDWNFVKKVPVNKQGSKRVWAPEWFKDPKDGSINVIVSIETDDDGFAPYILTSTGKAGEFTDAEALKLHNYGNGGGQPHIDMFIVHVASDTATPYHAFMKNEDEKHIEHLTSSSLKGTWEYRQTNDFAGWEHQEGPALTTLPDGKWILWMDNYHGNFGYATSDDLYKWSQKIDMPSHNKQFRHGTVIRQ
ncbi:glycoside hydrolase family 43 protein [Hypoxylon rubiginosum]|uniref:Glycoside hydrolase family 43 protein n=1 Tax=Hypoxylon rubiginosum TaxID=110542 RepID=A0ACC0D1W9_9PEZI|nr:glycoside hydrolase family 43 protein [Hypoxylon rubiginosum]